MNERIRELAEQAGAVEAKHITNTLGDMVLVGEEEIEKFAQLIARSCVVICADQIAGTVGTYASAHNSAVKKCIDGIQAHFGLDTIP